MLHRKDPSLHNNGAHVQCQLFHGDHGSTEGLPVDRIGVRHRLGPALLLSCHFCGQTHNFLFPDRFQRVKQSLPLQFRTGFKGDLRVCAEPILQTLPHLGCQLFQRVPAVGGKPYRQAVFAPLPFCPGKGRPGHGIQFHEIAHQFLRLAAVQFSGRMGHMKFQPSQTIERPDFPACPLQQAHGNIARPMGIHHGAALFRIQIRVIDDCPCQRASHFLRGQIIGKHS